MKIVQSGSLGARALRWAERLLLIVGAGMLVWCAALVADAYLSQRLARQSLETAAVSHTPAAPAVPKGSTSGPPRAPLARGSAVADLSIPRVHLSAMVLHGSDAKTLRRGPGHLENTALPGESGNVVIAGHRDSFFRPLRNVRLGDDIYLNTPHARLHYRVTSLEVVNPHDLSVLQPTADAVLTLITCYPFWVLGNAPDRFIVRAAHVLNPLAPPVAIPTASPKMSVRAPLMQRPAAKIPAVLTTAGVSDDETLVRQTIERFRLTYNARLISHGDVRRGGPLGFQTCGKARRRRETGSAPN